MQSSLPTQTKLRKKVCDVRLRYGKCAKPRNEFRRYVCHEFEQYRSLTVGPEPVGALASWDDRASTGAERECVPLRQHSAVPVENGHDVKRRSRCITDKCAADVELLEH